MKELESRLAERDAMIRVLQKKHSFEKDVSGSYPSICLGHHTPHSSLNTTDLTSDDLGKYFIILYKRRKHMYMTNLRVNSKMYKCRDFFYKKFSNTIVNNNLLQFNNEIIIKTVNPFT